MRIIVEGILADSAVQKGGPHFLLHFTYQQSSFARWMNQEYSFRIKSL